jgi:hypothetical protein
MSTQYSIMVIEVADFSVRSESARAVLRNQLHEVVRHAADTAGVSWQDVLKVDICDGSMMIALPGVSPARVAGPVVTAIDGDLAAQMPGGEGVPPMRLCVALHIDPADGDQPGPSVASVSHACVLVKAQPLNDALRSATRAHLAVIASDKAYQSSIRHEYRSVDSAAYLQVRVDTSQAKDVMAWVTVPGYSAPPGIRAAPGPQAGAEPPRGPGPAGAVPPSFSQYAGIVMGDQVGHKTVHNHGGGPR